MSITSRINEMSSHIEQAYDELQGLGADLTNVNKNIENISMVLDDIYDSMPQVSGEGTSLTLDDTRVGKIKSTLKGNTSQSGTPTPTSPIPVNVVSGDNEIVINGVNLLKQKQFTTTTANGITFTPVYENGLLQYININGTATADVSYMVSEGYATTSLLSGAYTNSDTIKILGTGTSNIKVYTNRVSIVYGEATASITNVVTNELQWMLYRVSSGATINNVKVYPFAYNYTKLGDVSYEPYQGNTYNIDLPVENLAELENGSLWDNNGAERDLANSVRTKFISFESGMTITPKIFTSLTTRYLQYCLYDSSKTFISLNSFVDGTAITTSNTSVKYIRFKMTGPVNGSMTIDDINFMVVKGDKAPNKYTPYGTTPIELCSSQDGTKRDYLLHDKTIDKWYWHREIGERIFNGTESWSYNSSGSYFVIYNPISDIDNKEQYSSQTLLPQLISNYYTPQTWQNFNNGAIGFAMFFANNTLQMRLSSSLTSVDAFKSWLGTNQPIFKYILATPTNTEITYQPLIDQLNLLEKAMSKDGQTNISQVNNDLPFIISASALKEWQESTSLNSTLSMVNPLSLGNTLNTQENNTQPIEVDNIEPLEEEENEES